MHLPTIHHDKDTARNPSRRNAMQRALRANNFATWRNARPEPVDAHMERTVRYGLIPKGQRS